MKEKLATLITCEELIKTMLGLLQKTEFDLLNNKEVKLKESLVNDLMGSVISISKLKALICKFIK